MFLGKVDFVQAPQPSDSLLPVVEGNLIGHIESKAGRGQVADKTEVARAGLVLDVFTNERTRKHCQNTDTKPVKR